METLEGSRGTVPYILNLGTRWRLVISFTIRIGGLVGPRAGLDTVDKKKNPVAGGNRTRVFQLVAYSLYWVRCPAFFVLYNAIWRRNYTTGSEHLRVEPWTCDTLLWSMCQSHAWWPCYFVNATYVHVCVYVCTQLMHNTRRCADIILRFIHLCYFHIFKPL